MRDHSASFSFSLSIFSPSFIFSPPPRSLALSLSLARSLARSIILHFAAPAFTATDDAPLPLSGSFSLGRSDHELELGSHFPRGGTRTPPRTLQKRSVPSDTAGALCPQMLPVDVNGVGGQRREKREEVERIRTEKSLSVSDVHCGGAAAAAKCEDDAYAYACDRDRDQVAAVDNILRPCRRAHDHDRSVLSTRALGEQRVCVSSETRDQGVATCTTSTQARARVRAHHDEVDEREAALLARLLTTDAVSTAKVQYRQWAERCGSKDKYRRFHGANFDQLLGFAQQHPSGVSRESLARLYSSPTPRNTHI